MFGEIYELRIQFLIIRAAALRLNQAMIAYLAEMGVEECDDQMARLRSKLGH